MLMAALECEVAEFIDRYREVVDEAGRRQVLYYGAYANASNLRARQKVSTEPALSCPDQDDLEAPTPFQRQRRMRWAQLIRRVWLEDPLLCPDCGEEMGILSFITEPPVVDRILRHVGWRHGKPLSRGNTTSRFLITRQ